MLDRPPDGNKAVEGLVFEEYSRIIAGQAGNFVDDGTWWVKALPRGEIHALPLQVVDEFCTEQKYEHFRYDYAAATPSVRDVPGCGRFLSALELGHDYFQASPQFFQLEATAYARLTGLRVNPVFGTSLRFVTENATRSDERFPRLTRVDIAQHEAQTLSFVASLSGSTFEAVALGELTSGAASTLAVTLRLYPRAGADPGVKLGVFAMSSMFWKRDSDTMDQTGDEAHDADLFIARSREGRELTVPLSDPEFRADSLWQRTILQGPLDTVALRQSERDATRYGAYSSARYGERPSLTVSGITANVPLSVELALAHTSSEYLDNVVVNIFTDVADASGPVEVNYTITASSN